MGKAEYFSYATPESQGISTEQITEFVKDIEKKKLVTHDLIIARGNKIIFEAYWKPFTKEFRHRQYSVTKSFTAIAVGFLIQDGLVDIDDPIDKYFPEKITEKTDYFLRKQTIGNMLSMRTAMPCRNWFSARTDDRVRFYFENDYSPSVPGGTLFRYDSSGTFVLGALVEKLTGMKLTEYLRSKLFDKIGISENVECYTCPGGYSWSDSALICTPIDLLKAARFTMNYGKWNSEQLLSREFLKDATAIQAVNNTNDSVSPFADGYGYYIWHSKGDSFYFDGMGGQLAVCVPEKDLIMICNGDNQGKGEFGIQTVFDDFFSLICDKAKSSPLPENPAAASELEKIKDKLELISAKGIAVTGTTGKISKKTYKCTDNPMGIKELRFEFSEHSGILYYENAQGKKKLKFGINRNEFTEFPQDGYSDTVGSVKGNRRYACAASACWLNESVLYMKVQIIDTYFGNLHATFSFKDDYVAVEMEKTAEDFLNEYQGRACGKIQ